MKANDYSGLVTGIAVLSMVIYANGRYDFWDLFLGVVGLWWGIQYIQELTGKDRFCIFLVTSLLAISLTAFLHAVIEILYPHWIGDDQLDKVEKCTFGLFFLLSLIVIGLFTRDKAVVE